MSFPTKTNTTDLEDDDDDDDDAVKDSVIEK